MEFGWTQAEVEYRAALREFLDEERPEWRDRPAHRRVITADEKAAVRDFTGKLAERGWLTPSWSAEYGGSGQMVWYRVYIAPAVARLRPASAAREGPLSPRNKK